MAQTRIIKSKHVALGTIIFLLGIMAPVYAQIPSAFSVSATVTNAQNGNEILSVSFTVPEHHYLYQDQIHITSGEDVILSEIQKPKATPKYDAFQEKEVSVYEKDITFSFLVENHPKDASFTVKVAYQGCNESLCFLPTTKTFVLGAPSATKTTTATPAPDTRDSNIGIGQFVIRGRTSGYVKPDEFLSFIQQSESGETTQEGFLGKVLETKGIWIFVFLVLAGGLALNLTPCVLPMIPVNLAIIGAGTKAGSRGQGFLLGGIYGAGIAIAYGLLGVLVVLTGTKFGTLNASPWFNITIGLVFGIMAMAMFNIITVDFSRFMGNTPTGLMRAGRYIMAFVLGAIAALLAGACVAPVVIAVLLLSTDLYAGGQTTGLLLPFLLGVGMALPWPFAGAGLSFLPKPGKWMEIVKHIFGVIILLFALWYVYLGISILRDRSPASRQAVAAAQKDKEKEGWLTSLDEALVIAARENKPVFIDFWATWCKNCLHMEHTTFKDPAVRESLNSFIKVKYQAENLQDPKIREDLDRFGVIGLPTYVILARKEEASVSIAP